MAYEKGVSPIRDYVLQQMTEVPGLMKSLADRPVGGHGRSFDPNEVMQTLNPYNYVRYDPSLGTKHHKKGAGGWDWRPKTGSAYTDMINSEVYSDLVNLSAGQKNKGTKAGTANAMMASRLHDVGISDLDQVGYTADPNTGKIIFYDRATGQAIPQKLKGTNKGDGMQEIYLTVNEKGQVIPRNAWKDTSDMGKIAGGLGLVAGLFAPMAIGALAPSLGTVGASAAYGAGTGALTSAIGGGDILKGALTGGLTGGAFGAIGPGVKLPDGTVLPQYNLGQMAGINSPLGQQAFNHVARGVISGATQAGAYGGDPWKGAALGGLSGLGGFAGSPAVGGGPLMNSLGASLGSQAVGRIGASLIGSPYDAPQRPQRPQQQAVQQPQQLPDWLPPDARQRILSVQGTNYYG